MPYGWQPIGERKLVPVSVSSYPSLQALGFQKPDGTIRYYFHRGTVNSETVIEAIEHFASYLRRPATLVIDNSRVHTSVKFNARLEHWKERALTIFRLPTYSPELNGIEGQTDFNGVEFVGGGTDMWRRTGSQSCSGTSI